MQVVVKGVPYAYAWQELKDLFKPLGAVKADIAMSLDGQSKGWGTVLFDSKAEAENAIKVAQLTLDLQPVHAVSVPVCIGLQQAVVVRLL